MKIFLSHKQDDSNLATLIARQLRTHHHEVYLDVVDTNFAKDGDDLGEYIRGKLGECDSLLAVISAATSTSWWVPWEIGVATEKNHPLSTYLGDSSAPPEYLRKWPVLRTLRDLDRFALLLPTVTDKIRRFQVTESKSATEARRLAVSEFHRQLKQNIL
jgi:hypothetical protein